MSTTVTRRVGALGAATVLAGSALLMPQPSAGAATRLICRASMSDSTPAQYSYDYVRVRTAPSARVRTVAHYKTTNTVHRGKANRAGRASIKYYISGATPGYRVRVDVTVTKNGHSRRCSTSFVPHR